MIVTFADWMIVVVFFAIFLAMAIYLNAQCRSVADYLVSGRKVRMWLGMGAGLAGEIGLVSIAAMCEQGYLHGFSFVLLAILSMVILTPLFGYFGFGIERFRASKAMSVPQYIEMRVQPAAADPDRDLQLGRGRVPDVRVSDRRGRVSARAHPGTGVRPRGRRDPPGRLDHHGHPARVQRDIHVPRRLPDPRGDELLPYDPDTQALSISCSSWWCRKPVFRRHGRHSSKPGVWPASIPSRERATPMGGRGSSG